MRDEGWSEADEARRPRPRGRRIASVSHCRRQRTGLKRRLDGSR